MQHFFKISFFKKSFQICNNFSRNSYSVIAVCARSTKSRQKYHGKQTGRAKMALEWRFLRNRDTLHAESRVKKTFASYSLDKKSNRLAFPSSDSGVTIISRKYLKFYGGSFYTRTRVKSAIQCFASRLKGMQHREHYALLLHSCLSTFFTTFNHFHLYHGKRELFPFVRNRF